MKRVTKIEIAIAALLVIVGGFFAAFISYQLYSGLGEEIDYSSNAEDLYLYSVYYSLHRK